MNRELASTEDMDDVISVKKTIVHHLIKKEGVQKANVEYSEKLMDTSELVKGLIEKLDSNYHNRHLITYAVFNQSCKDGFPIEFKKYGLVQKRVTFWQSNYLENMPPTSNIIEKLFLY